MPNWCTNRLVVTGSRGDVEAFYQANKTTSGPLSFDAGVPDSGGEDWHEWRVNHWGTKWDVTDADYDRIDDLPEPGRCTATYDFTTAWAPPASWLRTVGPRFPGCEFDLHYDEPGMGFAGTVTVTAGGVVETEKPLSGGSCGYEDCDEYAHRGVHWDTDVDGDISYCDGHDQFGNHVDPNVAHVNAVHNPDWCAQVNVPLAVRTAVGHERVTFNEHIRNSGTRRDIWEGATSAERLVLLNTWTVPELLCGTTLDNIVALVADHPQLRGVDAVEVSALTGHFLGTVDELANTVRHISLPGHSPGNRSIFG